ncbi:MAG: VWA domain-containing protein [Flavobacteriaceae bacterium]|nr:VWA domain-containing protein [Flavobacteriaceae bacterium]
MFKEVIFANPSYLWLMLIIIPCIIWYLIMNNKSQAILKISSTKGFGNQFSFWSKIRPILLVFRVVAIILLVLAIARPQTVDISTKTKMNKGIDIVMAIDVSSSMLAQDLKPNRLSALKKVASNFIDDRINDRIGLVVYAGESYTKTPITSDKGIVKKSLLDIFYDGVIEDGTAIGMGLATSVNRLKESMSKSKVIILLTDGVNNSGFIDPKIATELAIEYKIKTYTIGLGSNGNARAPIGILPNGEFQYGITKVEIDEDLLKKIAKNTGGIYFRATDVKRLQDIYNEINKLEKTEIEEIKYYNYNEKYRILVLIAFLLLIFEWIIKNTIYKSFI